MLAQIKRKDELDRVNKKFGSGKQPTPQAEAKVLDDTMLQKTTNLLDEAERALLSPSDRDVESPRDNLGLPAYPEH